MAERNETSLCLRHLCRCSVALKFVILPGRAHPVNWWCNSCVFICCNYKLAVNWLRSAVLKMKRYWFDSSRSQTKIMDMKSAKIYNEVNWSLTSCCKVKILQASSRNSGRSLGPIHCMSPRAKILGRVPWAPQSRRLCTPVFAILFPYSICT